MLESHLVHSGTLTESEGADLYILAGHEASYWALILNSDHPLHGLTWYVIELHVMWNDYENGEIKVCGGENFTINYPTANVCAQPARPACNLNTAIVALSFRIVDISYRLVITRGNFFFFLMKELGSTFSRHE